MKKLFTLLIAVLFSMVWAMSMSARVITARPNASATASFSLLTIENTNWTSALDVASAAPDGTYKNPETGDEIVSTTDTNCVLNSVPIDLKYGQVSRFEGFGKAQCNIDTFGITTVKVTGGSVSLHTSAVFTDPGTGQRSRIDVPVFTDSLPISPVAFPNGGGSDAMAVIERLSNGYDGKSTYLGLFAKHSGSNVTIKIYDNTGKLAGIEETPVTRATFYGIKTKVLFGRAEVYNGYRRFSGYPATDDVYVVQFEGYASGGAPRVEIPAISRSIWTP